MSISTIDERTENPIENFRLILTQFQDKIKNDSNIGIDEVNILIHYFDANFTGFKPKQKRPQSKVPIHELCKAKRANGQQCSRRKKPNCDFCGTHEKGRPNGIVENNVNPQVEKKDIWAEDFYGVVYYIDDEYNVYKHEDILQNKLNPRIIAKWKTNFESKEKELIWNN
jgi:hypothetical protein